MSDENYFPIACQSTAMTYLVAFDASPLATTALARAATFAGSLEVPLVVVTAVPRGNAAYARERGWIGDDEAYDRGRGIDRLRDRVATRAPRASFRPVDADLAGPIGGLDPGPDPDATDAGE